MSKDIAPAASEARGGPPAEKLRKWGIQPKMAGPHKWDEIAGMEQEKRLIEDKIVLPLQHPRLAQKHGVSTPKAILLFGPPGTGKTSFSQGIAGKLGCPFVEVSPSELAVDGLHRQASRLRAIFELLLGIERAVIFFDEFEELALRPDRASTTGRIVGSEMLKQIPRFRENPGLLLICATNNISLLSPALLRPGRFDYVLPVGPMDARGREEVFRHYLGRLNQGEMDLAVPLEKTPYFTPADIEAVCSQAAHEVFEGEVATGSDRRVGTDDLLRAIEGHKATLSPEGLAEFRKEIRQFCRADYCRAMLGDE